MNSKKGAIGETFTMLLATITIVVILVIFFAVFKVWTAGISLDASQKEKSISFAIQETATLESYLKSAVSVNEGNITMADLIRATAADSQYKQEYKEKLGKATADFFLGYKDFNLYIPSIPFTYSNPGLSPIVSVTFVVSPSFSK